MIKLIIVQAIFIVGNIWMAWYHSRLIANQAPIKHGLWSAGYLGCVGIICLFLGFLCGPVLILGRAVVFSPALNYFRKLPLDHISTSTTSIIDKLERKYFRSFRQKMLWYLVGLAVFEILLIITT